MTCRCGHTGPDPQMKLTAAQTWACDDCWRAFAGVTEGVTP